MWVAEGWGKGRAIVGKEALVAMALSFSCN